MSLPEKTNIPGWPDFLRGKDGNVYVLLRDGSQEGKSGSYTCLYGYLRPDGYVDRSNQWVPFQGVSEADMRLSGITWMTSQQLDSLGEGPIVVPEEPVVAPPAEEKAEDERPD